MFKDYNCVRVMICIPSSRVSMLKWVERRNYVKLGASSYPFNALGHTPSTSAKVELVQFIKTKASLLNSNDDADGKYGKILSLVKAPATNEHSVPSTTVVSETAETFAGDSVSISNTTSNIGHGRFQTNEEKKKSQSPLVPASTSGSDVGVGKDRAVPPAGNPRLPPLWRHLSVSDALTSSSSNNAAAVAEDEEEELYASDSKVMRKGAAASTQNSANERDADEELDLGVD